MGLAAFGEGDKKLDRDIRAMAQRVLFHGAGPHLLRFLLVDLGTFDTQLETEAERARADYGRRLMWLLGITDADHIEVLVNNLIKSAYRGEQDA